MNARAGIAFAAQTQLEIVELDLAELPPQMLHAPKAGCGRAEDSALLEDLCEMLKFGSRRALVGFTLWPMMRALKQGLEISS